METGRRTYEETHPWLRFDINLSRAEPAIWLALGEIQSKCQHLAGVPMKPHDARALHALYLAKGIMATTAIEGNSLSEEDVEKRIRGDLRLPPAKEYLGIEIDNVLRAANRVMWDAVSSENVDISIAELRLCNREILTGLEVETDVIPGEIRQHRVTVGRYRGAPPEDCEFLLGKMCAWLNGQTFVAPPGQEIVYGVIKAIVAHVYLAWIHPFGDGNGRTARLLEVRSLLAAGAPTSAAHLLSNYYNQTRPEYYRKLDEISRNGGDILPFLKYAVVGFCEQLREQLVTVRKYLFASTWQNYVHESFHDKKTETDHRRRQLVLAISEHLEGVQYAQLRRLNVDVAERYAQKTVKTLHRDLNALIDLELIVRDGRIIKANFGTIAAFMPRKRGPLPPGLLPTPSDGGSAFPAAA